MRGNANEQRLFSIAIDEAETYCLRPWKLRCIGLPSFILSLQCIGLPSFLLSLLYIDYLILVDGLFVETWFLRGEVLPRLLALLIWAVHGEMSRHGFDRQCYCPGTNVSASG